MPHLRYELSGFSLEAVDSYRYLGLHLSSDFSWTTHIDILVKRACHDAFLVRRLIDHRLAVSDSLRNDSHRRELISTATVDVRSGTHAADSIRAQLAGQSRVRAVQHYSCCAWLTTLYSQAVRAH